MWGKVVAFFAGMAFVFVLLFVFGMCMGHYHDSSHDYEIDEDEDEEAMVYISTSPRAKVYHVDPYCKWLRQTEYKIEEVSVEFATAKGRRPCKGCSTE